VSGGDFLSRISPILIIDISLHAKYNKVFADAPVITSLLKAKNTVCVFGKE